MSKKKGTMYGFMVPDYLKKASASEEEHVDLDNDADLNDMLKLLEKPDATVEQAGINKAEASPKLAKSGKTFAWPTTDVIQESENVGPRPPKRVATDDQYQEEAENKRPRIFETVDATHPLDHAYDDTKKQMVGDNVATVTESLKDTHVEAKSEGELIAPNANISMLPEFVEEEPDESSNVAADVDATTKRMYWIETYEDVYKNPGTVYLFGRMGGKSCCIVAKNIEHKIYFVPRKFDEEGNADFTAIHNEIQANVFGSHIFKNDKKKVLRVKPVDIKYVPTDNQPPQSVKALMALYKGSLPKVHLNTSGNTFSHVLNTTSTAMERFLTETKLRGPCWVDITNSYHTNTSVSHCELEYSVDMRTMSNIRPAEFRRPCQDITLLSLNILATPSASGKDNEINMISCLLRKGITLDSVSKRGANENLQKYQRHCFFTPTKQGVLSMTWPDDLKKAGINTDCVHKVDSERALLNQFLAKLKQFDPDVIVAHDICAQLTLLISRVEKHNIKTWSFVSRLRRDFAPGRLIKTKAGQWELTAGRSALCSRTAAEELYPSRSYEMADLLPLLAPEKRRIALTQTLIAHAFDGMSKAATFTLAQLINCAWMEAYYALLIIFRLNALPLFTQITQIVGGVMSRTLLGGRSERNEYLLLHAFSEADYVPPNKRQFSAAAGGKKKAAADEEGDAEDDAKPTSALKKAQYTGGLVLEPKKGFYEHYIVLLDFNSLYPSIIQEFNLCFTTVPRCYEEPDESGLPEPPKSELAEGILPVQISNLVRSRREVKAQMKRVAAGSDEYLQLDVRQKGLKLTANSMYGCLGFGMSRFCAKTLAAMVTSKGRELLSRTKEIVEKRGYIVVYGDTDSIMVNTNSPRYVEARRLADELRKCVNGGFKHVEMDVDGLFKRLLLLKKKKYAALAVGLNDEHAVKREMKGLDIVRRDWSSLARDIGERVVDLILHSGEREELVLNIVRALEELAADIRAHKLPLQKFEVLKQLTKAPKDYADAKNQPHVQVALRRNAANQANIRQGDIVKYVICEDGTSNSATQRAYHVDELTGNENLAIDVLYYLSHQVHPVVMRLCEPFAELDSARIAEAMGLDAAAYRGRGAAVARSHEDDIISAATSSIFDMELYEGFKMCCPSCKKVLLVRSPFNDDKTDVTFSFDKCVNCGTELLAEANALKAQLKRQLNGFLRKYAESPYLCEDATCGRRQQEQLELTWTSSYGPTCPQCKTAVMKKEFTLRDLFFQQRFYQIIFDWKAMFKAQLSETARGKLKERASYADTTHFYDECEAMIAHQIEHNRFNRVNLKSLLCGFRTRLFV